MRRTRTADDPIKRARLVITLLVVLLTVQVGPSLAETIRISTGFASVVRLENPADTIIVGDPKIADATAGAGNTVIVTAKAPGKTNLIALDKDGKILRQVDVDVGLDTRDIAGKIEAGIGSHAIRVSSRGSKIVLSGTVADAPSVERAVNIASALAPEGGGVINALRVDSPQQVMLQVRLLEISRTAGRELGVNLFGAGPSGARGINTGLGSVTGAGRVPAAGELPLITTAGTLVSGASPYVTILANLMHANGTTVDAAITALETRGLARRLAEPNLIALSGDSADFLAGGEFPVPIASTTQGGVPTITVQFKEFGVRLSFTPTVLASGIINLRLEPEVSEIDRSISVSTGAVVVPGLSKRRAKTTIELRDGQSFAIAGLLQSINQSDIDQFPWLGSVPVLGALFRSTQFQRSETELVVLVTPHLVQPTAPGDALASPLDSSAPSNDVDLFLFGQQERKKQRPSVIEQYVTPAGNVTGPHGHILTSPLPNAVPAPVLPPASAEATVRVKD